MTKLEVGGGFLCHLQLSRSDCPQLGYPRGHLEDNLGTVEISIVGWALNCSRETSNRLIIS